LLGISSEETLPDDDEPDVLLPELLLDEEADALGGVDEDEDVDEADDDFDLLEPESAIGSDEWRQLPSKNAPLSTERAEWTMSPSIRAVDAS